MNKLNNSKKQRGGPNTDKGKLISSQNALKSGLTTKQLLNKAECAHYDQLIQKLSSHYGETNPLIPLQIERIARIQIQLERIQNAIDLLYRRAELNPPKRTPNNLEMNRFVFNLKIKILTMRLDSAVLKKIQRALQMNNISKYLQNRAEITAKSLSDEGSAGPIISQKSLLGCYLYAEAKFYNQEMNQYLEDKKLAASNSPNAKDLYKSMNIEVLLEAIDMVNSPDLQQTIVTEDEYEFRLFEDWFENGLTKIPEYLDELRRLEDPNQEKLNITLPNFDELDRLMRYQTTLSRQLSTAIGELIVLTK